MGFFSLSGLHASLKDNINQMIANLKNTTQTNAEQDWLKTNLARFSGMMQGQKDLETVSRLIMSQLTPLVSAHHGAFFMMDSEANAPLLKLTSSYAYRERKSVSNRFLLGEGLVGQCALEKKSILLTQVPSDYIAISSGLGEATPLNIVVLPVLFEGEVKAVIELASFHAFSQIHQTFLDQLTESIGVVLNMISANMRTEILLQQSQGMTQELQAQSKELTVQQDGLKRSNSALEKQALELEDKARLLEEQKTTVELKNQEVEQARGSLEEKAEQLALISKYKSEFLANMSHELRTPLNSLLILAKLLSDNNEANLSEKQIEYAKTIHASGGDLLSLINEILDLSKVEAGKMQVEPREIAFTELEDFVARTFKPIADQKGLALHSEIGASLPNSLRTDPQRLHQVLKNLLANAVKFTESGSVTLKMFAADKAHRFANDRLRVAARVIGFAVVDTGIGIPKDKQKIIFEAFQQADGTTSRKYGGTGLGLSISREIARLLGGEIQVESVPGKGSTFTFYLPEIYVALEGADEGAERLKPFTPQGAPPRSYIRPPTADVIIDAPTLSESDAFALRTVKDDREAIRQGDRVLLIIEDDPKFAKIMVGMAQERGYKVVVTNRGDTGLALANELQPDAITLDVQLPVLNGWAVLDRLKRNPRTRHIPVHVISIVDRHQRGATMGAFAYIEKPVDRDTLESAFAHLATFLDRKVRRLLLVEDNPTERATLETMLGEGDDMEVVSAGTADEALNALDLSAFDCMVVDLILPGDGFHLIERLKTQARFRDLPIVVYTGKDLSVEEEKRLMRYVESIIVKTGLKSPDRLLADTAKFLHRVEATLPDRVKRALSDERELQSSLAGKKVLVVDDDVRNIFALTAVLEHHHMTVVSAENGRAGIEMLERTPDVDLVLMDIMMPEMDGYETMRAIRKLPQFQTLPLIAVTAKALKEDREKCLAAGASDYLPKPVEEEKLLELCKLWTRDREKPSKARQKG